MLHSSEKLSRYNGGECYGVGFGEVYGSARLDKGLQYWGRYDLNDWIYSLSGGRSLSFKPNYKPKHNYELMNSGT